MRHSSWLLITLFYILFISINQSSASNYELKEELSFIHQEIDLLRDENHYQNMEIALLKEKIGIADDQRIVGASTGDNHRNERPARLLPARILHGDRKNSTKQQKQMMNRRRYEQPTNCSDLSLLGYTLNGFYIVKSNESVNSNSTGNDIKLDTVYCAFKQPEGTLFNPSFNEKRIISRRETILSSVLCLHATRTTNLDVFGGQFFSISFENVNVNLGNAFHAITGAFTVQNSGIYILSFRGSVIFPYLRLGGQFSIYFTRNGAIMGRETQLILDVSMNVELDRIVKGSRGDVIMVGCTFDDQGVKLLGDSTSFAVYLLAE